jgi:hypothetical protein
VSGAASDARNQQFSAPEGEDAMRCDGLGTLLVVIALGGPEGKKKKG